MLWCTCASDYALPKVLKEKLGGLSQPSTVPYSLSSLGLELTVSSKFFNIQPLSVSTEKLLLAVMLVVPSFVFTAEDTALC